MALLAGSAQGASAAKPDTDIVVTGVRSALSNWRQAETSHVIVLSDGSEQELVRLTRSLERLHFLLSGLLGRGAVADDMVKIRITLIGDVAEFRAMHLLNKRWQQGPYNDLFLLSRYYDPRKDGVVMATTRADQRVVVEHTTVTPRAVEGVLSSLAMNAPDPQLRSELSAAIGGFDVTAGMRSAKGATISFGEKAIQISAENLLYAGYAQHFLLTYFPAAYPRWYLDGFGQVFSTFAVKGDNVVEFGRSPNGAPMVMHEFGPYPLKDVLSDAYLTQKPHKTGWTPIHAWALTHFLFFSDKRRPELRQYLTARANGADAASAGQIFGDQKQLAREMASYFYHRKPFYQITYDGSRVDQPIVRQLRESEAAFVKGRLELGARVEIPPAPTADMGPDEAKAMIKAREEALRLRDRWLADLRRDAARWSRELEAQLLLAEAECRSGNAAECLAAAERAQSLAPADTRPLIWKGWALVQQAAAATGGARAPLLAAARDMIIKANQADSDAVGPLLAYYASFADVGETPSVRAIDGLQKAMEEVPAAPEIRLELAKALVERGQTDVAKPVILPVAAGAYESPEKPAAKTLLSRIEASAIKVGGAMPADKTAVRRGSSLAP
jgi:hypothetical protein